MSCGCTPGNKNSKYRNSPSQTEDYRRNSHLMRKYDISLERYEQMLESQCGSCAICGGDNEGRNLAVDHDHVTGAIRSLLCTQCNAGIGSLRDDPEVMLTAADYIELHKQKESA